MITYLHVTDSGRATVHDHAATEPCPGWGDCYSMYFTIDALRSSLMNAVLDFANTPISHPDDVHHLFGGAFSPATVPRLRECRNIREHLRSVLTDRTDLANYAPSLGGGSYLEIKHGSEYRKQAGHSPEFGHIIATPFPIEGERAVMDILLKRSSTGTITTGVEPQRFMLFAYRFVNASLAELVEYGLVFIIEENLTDKVGLCEREGCDNIFLDSQSRGTPRKYCKTEECEKILVRERVARSRSAKK